MTDKSMRKHFRVWEMASAMMRGEAELAENAGTVNVLMALATLAHYVAEGYEREMEKK